ncbi:MAG: sporulation protein YqfD [Clostridiales bacterium]|nr:sporulation protein YqfD [Candidatus Cacconaster stercorequi]
MYRRVINFLRGHVALRVKTPHPERILNLCGAHDIPFWNFAWLSAEEISLCTTRSGLRRLRQVCDEETEIATGRERGVPVLWQRMKKRYALLAGLAIFWLALFGGSIFIWDFEVTGNDTVATETILRALENYGLTVGSMGISIDQEDVRNHVLLELPDISWLAVNVKGCTAHVQVVERLRPPEIVQEQEVTNVVARRSGLVTKVQALDGKAQVLPGTTVTEGELLISGVVDSDRHGMRLLHGCGSVWARTWYDLSVRVPLNGEKKTQEKKNTTRIALDFGKRRVKFYGKGSVTGGECDKIIRYRPVSVMGLRLPLTWVTEQTVRYDTAAQRRSDASARQEGEAQLLRELKELLGENGTVEHTRFAAARQGDMLVVTLRAECEEQIGETVVLPTE